ncbi:DUF2911 domain-containing protein [bacterium]|nr:DUF2911 domain-containing protein [bacterium]
MRILSITAALLIAVGISSLSAQDKKAKKSPMKTTEASIGKSEVTITYSSPSVKGRTIFGDLVAMGKIWRTGANEATTIESSGDIMVGGKSLKAGKYSIFTIPAEGKWTVIINSVSDQWGAYKYDESKDVFRVMTDKVETVEATEQFTIAIENGMLSFAWSTTKASVSIK